MAVTLTRAIDKSGVFRQVSKMLSKLNKCGFELILSSHASCEVAWEKQENFIACLVDKSDKSKMIAVMWNRDTVAHVKDIRFLCKGLAVGMRTLDYDADEDLQDTYDFEGVHAFVFCTRSSKLARKAAVQICSELDFLEKVTFCKAREIFAKIV